MFDERTLERTLEHPVLSQTWRKVGNNVLEKCEDKSISSIRICGLTSFKSGQFAGNM